MEQSFASRFKRAWNVLLNKADKYEYYGPGYSYRPDRTRLTRGNDRSIVTAVYNRIALDVSSIDIKHVRLDENDRFTSVIDSPLNNCLTLEPNLDQTARAFVQDVVLSMFDEGCVAIVPIETNKNPKTGSFDVLSMRVGKIVEWYPSAVCVRIYNELTGQKEDVRLPKASVAIIENPFYAVMNEPSSTVQRLIHKLSLMDAVDEESSSGKLDLIIQLPYVVKSDTRREQANRRRKEIEEQLTGSKYGVAYTDGTEKIVQLNRSLENNLLTQVQYLTEQMFSNLGITQGILDGTADEKTMLNYNNRIIEPIASAITVEMERKFLSKTARTQRQAIQYFREPFRLVPVSDIAEIADKFTRNEIMSSNEIRQIVGLIPSTDPSADELRNKNLNQSSEEIQQPSERDKKLEELIKMDKKSVNKKEEGDA